MKGNVKIIVKINVKINVETNVKTNTDFILLNFVHIGNRKSVNRSYCKKIFH